MRRRLRLIARSEPKRRRELGPEARLLIQCKHLLRMLENQGKISFVRLNVSAIPVSGGERFRPNPDMVGCPDLIVWIKDGPSVCIELKRPGGRLSAAQTTFGTRLMAIGHRYSVITTFDDFVATLKFFGVETGVTMRKPHEQI